MTRQELSAILEAIPFNRHIGMKLSGLHRDGVTVKCKLEPHHGNAAGLLHGGVTATLVDVAAGMAVTHRVGRPRAATTVELKINYLRPVVNGTVSARSHILRLGMHLCVSRVDVFDHQQRLAAVGLVTYMLLPRNDLDVRPANTPI